MVDIKILHTNDTHSYLDNFHKRKHFIEMKRKENEHLLLVDSGDNLRGSLFYSIFHGEKEPQLLNDLTYDYFTLGNHEFDVGSKGVYDFIKQLKGKVLLSNVHIGQDRLLKKLNNIYLYDIYEVENIKIGLFGLLTQTTQTSSSPSKDTIFLNPIQSAKMIVEKLQQENVDVIILLSHLGDDEDIKLAMQVSGIHYIIGAHTHKVLQQPLQIKNNQQWETTIVQAGSYGNYIGEIDIAVNDHHVEMTKYQLTDLREYSSYDVKTYELIKDMVAEIEKVSTKNIATVKVELNGKRDIIKYQSTNLTNLITDAYFAKAVALGFSPDIAIMNSGGIRRTIKKGIVTYGDILQVMPFGCELVVCQMSGQEIYKALMHGEYPQVSHAKLSYTNYDDTIRLEKMTIKKGNRYETLDFEKNYIVVTNTYISSGKDGYITFEGKENLVKESILDTDILIEYLQSLKQPIQYTSEIRKTVKSISIKTY